MKKYQMLIIGSLLVAVGIGTAWVAHGILAVVAPILLPVLVLEFGMLNAVTNKDPSISDGMKIAGYTFIAVCMLLLACGGMLIGDVITLNFAAVLDVLVFFISLLLSEIGGTLICVALWRRPAKRV